NRLVFGEGAWGFHLVNMALHVLNAMLVFVALQKIFERPIAGLCALLFLLHPLQTEAVNSIVGRAELLAAFWMLIAWVSFVFGAGRWRWVLAALAIFLGCLCKEHAATMVGILGVVAFLKVSRVHLESRDSYAGFIEGISRFYKEHLAGFFMCVGAVCLCLWMRYAVVGALLLPRTPTFIDNPLAHVDDWERWLNALSIIWRYGFLMLWPVGLSADYSFQAIPIISTLWTGSVLAGFCIVLLLTYFIIRAIRGNSPAIWGVIASWLAFPALPVSNLWFPIGTVMAERFMYVPVVGYCVFCGLIFFLMRSRWPQGVIAVACILLTVYGMNTVQRNGDWQNDFTLFSSVVRVAPESAKAHFNLGNAVRDRGDAQVALTHYRKALWIYPSYAEVYYNIGVVEQTRGQVSKAFKAYQNTLTSDSTHVNAWTNMGIILSQQGAYPKAVDAFEMALVLKPRRRDVRFNYALTLEKSGRLDEALTAYTAILSDEPGYEDAAIHLADLYVQQSKTEQAILTLQGVVNADGQAYQAALNLAALLERETRFEEALDAFQIGANGDSERSVLALFAAGRLYGRLGKFEDAKRALNTFLERWNGDNALAHRAEQMLRQLNID
ncbi:MAG: tetratricopeptide repeat protein, partial [Candidatus Latescibacteria bacterium]|nr:tetratricopeptide repeat protein [Candidatus Latescibacterota bacterium]